MKPIPELDDSADEFGDRTMAMFPTCLSAGMVGASLGMPEAVPGGEVKGSAVVPFVKAELALISSLSPSRGDTFF